MAFRELHVIEIREIIRLWTLGVAIRAIARQTSADRKTVRRYINAAQKVGLEKGDTKKALSDSFLSELMEEIHPKVRSTVGLMREHCRVNRSLIEGWILEGCKGPKIVKLLNRHSGIKVPLRTLQRFISDDLEYSKPQITVPVVDGDPGVLEVDFLTFGQFTDLTTGKVRKMHGLLVTAAYSRHQFVWPCLSQTYQDVVDGLEAAWDFFGGVFPILQPDNLKAIVTQANPTKPIFNTHFLEYAQSRGFQIDPARVRKPKDKARVERQVQYVRNDFFRGENFKSIDEARIEAHRWCLNDAGMRIHGRMRRRPLEVFKLEEKSHLLPMPQEKYDNPKWGDYKINKDHTVIVEYAMYSVPYNLKGMVRVRSNHNTIKIYQNSKLIKIHPRQPQGGIFIDPADLPPGKSEVATRDVKKLIVEAAKFGPHVEEYARKLAQGIFPWREIRFLSKLINLAKSFGEWVDEACRQALSLDVIDIDRLKKLLEKGLLLQSWRGLPPSESKPLSKKLRFERPASAFSITKEIKHA